MNNLKDNDLKAINGVTPKSELGKEIVYITRQQFIGDIMLQARFERMATFSHVVYFVDESKSKIALGKKLLQKLVCANATIGADYQAKVNKQLVKQGEISPNFEAEPMKGKEHINKALLYATKFDKSDYNGYMMCLDFENGCKPQVQLYKGGKAVNRADVWNEENITPSGLKPSTYTSGRGEVKAENDFARRTPYINNMRAIHMDGKRYIFIG